MIRMSKSWQLYVGIISAVVFSLPTHANPKSIPSFVASCDDVETHGYRNGTDILGRPMGSYWSTDEKFEGKDFETFVYRAGSNVIHIKNTKKQAPITGRRENILVAYDPYRSIGGSGIWTYVFNLKIGEVVAAEVNGADIIGSSVKARVVQLDCKFTYQ